MWKKCNHGDFDQSMAVGASLGFQNLLIFWDIHTQQSLEFMQHDMKWLMGIYSAQTSA